MPLTVWFAKESIDAIGVSRNKILAAVALNEEIISVVSVHRLIELWQCTIKNVSCCVLAPDDFSILYGKLETALHIATRKEILFFTENSETFVSCAFSRNGKRLVTSNRSKTIKLWDIFN